MPPSSPSTAEVPSAPPLTIELDEVLVRTDTLHEGLLRVLKHRPYLLPGVLGWALKGRDFLRAEVARRAELDVAWLPYNEALLSRLREEKARGRRLVLVTRADRRVAEAVAAHLGLFDEVHAGRKALDGPFEAISPSASRSPGPRALLGAMRVHQWAKNILIFVPLLAAHRALEWTLLLQAAWGFIAFSLCASSVYVLNDLLDLEADRRHPLKRRRPFASGALSVRTGLWLAPALLAAGGAVASRLPPSFLALLVTYYLVTLGYSLHLKQVVMLDVLVLAGLYTVRLFGGSLVVGVPTSNWLLTFSMFLFLSLALVKRLSEVRRLRQEQQQATPGRGYMASDYEQLASLGVSSGYLSVLVLALYITSREVTALYTHPERLWLLCPLMLYWVGRVWLLAHRGQVNEDPLAFALQDKASYGVGLLAVGVLLSAT
jgi:4-hydroxybenzoate polyprenyltransferase